MLSFEDAWATEHGERITTLEFYETALVQRVLRSGFYALHGVSYIACARSILAGACC